MKKASKWKNKPQRMGHGEEAEVERNFFTAINRGECRAHGLLKAHVYPSGFARLCFCFEPLLLSNLVF